MMTAFASNKATKDSARKKKTVEIEPHQLPSKGRVTGLARVNTQAGEAIGARNDWIISVRGKGPPAAPCHADRLTLLKLDRQMEQPARPIMPLYDEALAGCLLYQSLFFPVIVRRLTRILGPYRQLC